MSEGEGLARRSVLAPSRGSVYSGAGPQQAGDQDCVRRPSQRQSGRYSSHTRYGRASVARGSVRGTARGPAVDASGLPFERIACVDEEGRDRTPKPLLAARPQGPEGPWGSEAQGEGSGPGSTVMGGGSDSRMSFFGGPLVPGGIPSARSFLASEAAEAAAEASLDGGLPGVPSGRSSAGRHAALPGTREALGAAVDAAEAGGSKDRHGLVAALAELGGGAAAGAQPSPKQEAQRSKATQCAAAEQASRGVQTLPWELRCSSSDGARSPVDGEAALEAAFLAQGGRQADGAAVDEGAGGGEGEGEEEALLAMQGQFVEGGSRRGSPTPSHRSMHSQASSRRGSVAGSARMPPLAGSHSASRPDTGLGSRRSSVADWSARDSVTSGRPSFAAFAADGRLSAASSAAGMYPPGFHPGGGASRASVLSVSAHQRRGSLGPGSGQAPAPPRLTAAELAAREQRRKQAEEERALARLPGLLRKLQTAERAVLATTQHAKLAQYHGVQFCLAHSGSTQPEDAEHQHQGEQSAEHPSAACSSASAPALAGGGTHGAAEAGQPGAPAPLGGGRAQAALPLLWTFQSELSGELPVSCLAFNREAPDLLAVGYGRLEYSVPGAGAGGLVAVWSLANPTHPLWHAAAPCGVSALDWSGKAPGCLAVGFFDGGLALYDVRGGGGGGGHSGRGSAARSRGAKPLAHAPPAGPSGAAGGHAEPVWRLQHVPRATDPGEEMLVSVSTDGRVLEWRHTQGLERSELLRLKRQQAGGGAAAAAAPQQKAGAAAGYLGRRAGATCCAFHPDDARTYLVGTEDGCVHRCSTAFTEQVVGSFHGHLAPVYQVCWSPLSPSHFLTASADGTVRLWREGHPRSLWTFQAPGAKGEVADVAFCPTAATMFAAAAGNTLQLWDIERSVLTPRATATCFGVRLTALAFSQVAPVVVTGADNGVVSVYSLAAMVDAFGDGGGREEQRQRLEAALQVHTSQQLCD